MQQRVERPRPVTDTFPGPVQELSPVLYALPRLEIGPAASGSDAPPGEVRQRWFDHDGRLIATGGRQAASWWMHWAGLATFWFGESGDVRAEPRRDGFDSDLHDIFTRGVTPVVLLARGFEGLHASAVESDRGAVAFVGTSGTGKSTTALAVASTGLIHTADDTVVYQVLNGAAVAVSLPFPVRVESSVRSALAPSTRHDAGNRQGRRAAFARIYHMVRDGSVDPAEPTFVPVPPHARFELLLAHAHPFEMGTEGRNRAFMENLLTLARSIDVWECRFAPGLSALPSLAAAIRAHVDSL